MEQPLFNHSYEFPRPAIDINKVIIKVIGVGGGGTNAANHMARQGIKNVNFAVMNTDAQALEDSPIDIKIQLGAKLTEGLGAGTNPIQGRAAAEESIEDIKTLLSDGTKMVFITAGMGGGTGTGAAPVVARVARDLGLLTVDIVTAPNDWEGEDKIQSARNGMGELQEYCDTVLVVLNDKLIELYPDDDIEASFARADDVLLTAAKSVAEMITKSGTINVDFMDVRNVLKNAGQAVMGSATMGGKDRAQLAIQAALDSPLLDNRNIQGAKRVLLSVAYSNDFKAKGWEQKNITETLKERIAAPAKGVKLGYIKDDTLGDQMRVTVIVAGFDLPADEQSFIEPKQEPIVQAVVVEVEEEEEIIEPVQEIAKEVPQKTQSVAKEVLSHTNNDSTPIVKDTKPNKDSEFRKVETQRMIAHFMKNKPDEVILESPAFERYGVKLINLEDVKEPLVRYSLSDK
jgi:cell division protein FtsZ